MFAHYVIRLFIISKQIIIKHSYVFICNTNIVSTYINFYLVTLKFILKIY